VNSTPRGFTNANTNTITKHNTTEKENKTKDMETKRYETKEEGVPTTMKFVQKQTCTAIDDGFSVECSLGIKFEKEIRKTTGNPRPYSTRIGQTTTHKNNNCIDGVNK
jgi:hypothetical protein